MRKIGDRWPGPAFSARLVAGPAAVVLAGLIVLRVSPEPVTWRGVSLFTAVALPTWAVLHAILGRVMRFVAKLRHPLSDRLLNITAATGGSRRAWASLLRDPPYLACYTGALAVKWLAVICVGCWAVL